MRYVFPLLLALLIGCTSTRVSRYPEAPKDLEPVPVSEVKVYDDTSELCDYDAIAELVLGGSLKGMEDRLLREAKQKAADLGGNALVKGRTVQQGASFNDFAGNTYRAFAAVREHRPCE